MFGRFRRKRHRKIEVLKGTPGATLVRDGRYLIANMSVSLKSHRGRRMALDLAAEIASAVDQHREEKIGEREPVVTPGPRLVDSTD